MLSDFENKAREEVLLDIAQEIDDEISTKQNDLLQATKKLCKIQIENDFEFYQNGQQKHPSISDDIFKNIKKLEKELAALKFKAKKYKDFINEMQPSSQPLITNK